jgi:polar amino acid transport system substrate-binding protein
MTAGDSLAARAELAPGGILRVGLNMSNFLLTATDAATGEPTGIAADLGRALGARLGVPVSLRTYPGAGALADAAASDEWDVAFLAVEPARTGQIDFTPAYAEIEATYLVPAGSPLKVLADVDRAGVRIAAPEKSAYELYLTRTLAHAGLVRTQGADAAFALLAEGEVDALAGLKARLLADRARLPGSRILDGRFTAVQQAAGTPKGRPAGATYLSEFIRDVKATGLTERLIARHGVTGLSPVR